MGTRKVKKNRRSTQEKTSNKQSLEGERNTKIENEKLYKSTTLIG